MLGIINRTFKHEQIIQTLRKGIITTLLSYKLIFRKIEQDFPLL